MSNVKSSPAQAPASVILIRLMVGCVFFFEGVLKFLYPDELAAGRFATIGIPHPQTMGPFVGGVEIICGVLLVIGFLTRLVAVPLVIDITVAILSTKIPILFGQDFLGFHLVKFGRVGRRDFGIVESTMLCKAWYYSAQGSAPRVTLG